MLKMISGINKYGQHVSFLADVSSQKILRADRVYEKFISELGNECNTLCNLKIDGGRFIFNWKKYKGRLQTESRSYRWSFKYGKVIYVPKKNEKSNSKTTWEKGSNF